MSGKRTIALTEVYPNLRVPYPGKGEWIDFFVVPTAKRHSLYWRLNDGPHDDPDVVIWGYISGHRHAAEAHMKLRHLVRAAVGHGIAA